MQHVDAGDCDLALIDRGYETADRNGQTRDQIANAERRVCRKRCDVAAHQAGVERDDDRDQKTVDALRTGKKLQKQALTGKIRILRNDARRRLTRDTDADRGTDTCQ